MNLLKATFLMLILCVGGIQALTIKGSLIVCAILLTILGVLMYLRKKQQRNRAFIKRQ